MSKVIKNSHFRLGFREKEILELIKTNPGIDVFRLKKLVKKQKPKRVKPVLKTLIRKNLIYNIGDRFFLIEESSKFTFYSKDKLIKHINGIIQTGLFKVENNHLYLIAKFPYFKLISGIRIPCGLTPNQEKSYLTSNYLKIHYDLELFKRNIASWSNNALSSELSEEEISVKKGTEVIRIPILKEDLPKDLARVKMYCQILSNLLNHLSGVRRSTEIILERKLERKEYLFMEETETKDLTLPELKKPETLTISELFELSGMVLNLLNTINFANQISKGSSFQELLIKLPLAVMTNKQAQEQFNNIVKFLCDNTELDELAAIHLLPIWEGVFSFIQELNLLPFFYRMTTTLSQLIEE